MRTVDVLLRGFNDCEHVQFRSWYGSMDKEGSKYVIFHGTNHFEIHVLNDKGVRADENRCDLSRREYQLTLKDYVI